MNASAFGLYVQAQILVKEFWVVSISRLESGWLSRRREILIVLSSLLLQVPLAYFLGHYYDERVFMATGYVVNSGANPYQPIELMNVFSHPLLNGMVPRVGYPPPWPLILGLIFRLSYKIVPDVFVYNFAIKIPTIIANVGLAYLVRNILVNLHASDRKAKGCLALSPVQPICPVDNFRLGTVRHDRGFSLRCFSLRLKQGQSDRVWVAACA